MKCRISLFSSIFNFSYIRDSVTFYSFGSHHAFWAMCMLHALLSENIHAHTWAGGPVQDSIIPSVIRHLARYNWHNGSVVAGRYLLIW